MEQMNENMNNSTAGKFLGTFIFKEFEVKVIRVTEYVNMM